MSKLKLESLNLRRLKPFSLPVVILLIILGSTFLLIKPRLGEISNVQRKIEQKERRLTQLAAKAAALEGVNQRELSEKTDMVGKVLPAEKDFPLFLFLLNKLARDNNLEVTNIQVDPGEVATVSAGTKKGDLPFLSFIVGLNGQMSDLKVFLGRVERAAPLMIIREVKTRNPEGEILETTILLEAPFLALPVNLGKIEQPLARITTEEEAAYQKITELDFSLIRGELPLVPSGKEDPFSF